MQQKRMSADAIAGLLYHDSGLLGVSGVSNDMRTLPHEFYYDIAAPGSIITNIGVQRGKADLRLECLWDLSIAITTRLV
jgi:acetate kinase